MDGFPATTKEFNIIRSKIDLLIGEETKRPFRYNVTGLVILLPAMQEKAKNMPCYVYKASIMAKMSPEDQARYQEAVATGEIMEPDQIAKYLTRDKDIAEIQAYHSLAYLSKS